MFQSQLTSIDLYQIEIVMIISNLPISILLDTIDLLIENQELHLSIEKSSMNLKVK